MLLSHKTTIKINDDYSNIIGHMCYAAYKLWNLYNYERRNHEKLGLSKYPDWYYQKATHKTDMWYKQLPSQSAQEVCKLLDKAWKSYFKLLKTGGVENPKPPRFKQSGIVVTYMQKGIIHEAGTDTVRLSLPKNLKAFMSENYGISENFLYLKSKVFENTDVIKQIKLYPPEHGEYKIIVIYEIADIKSLPDNGRYLSVDLGLHNLMTCFNSETGDTFIAGRKYLPLCRYYDKQIGHTQSRWSHIQYAAGVKHPKSSNHIRKLYEKKHNAVNDYLHKVTRYVVNYCVENGINTLVVGDLTGIRENNNKGHVVNQKLHGLPYKRIYDMLEYKCALSGIRFVKRVEAYSSQTSPLMPLVDAAHAEKEKRVKRGLYVDGDIRWNADCVGAYNILRLYLNDINAEINTTPYDIKAPYIVKVAV